MTQDLLFTKQDNGVYAADCTVNADFAVHIERVCEGRLQFSRSINSGGKKDPFLTVFGKEVFEQSFHDVVYPIYLHIESSVKVTSAVVKDNSNE